MLATIVGSANGRSISALTMRLPGNSSRTSTQAISVPITTLTRATMADTSTVTRSAARATGAVAASQNPLTPSSNEVTVSAASGSRTMTLSQRPRGRRRAGGRGQGRRLGSGRPASAPSVPVRSGRGGRDDPSVEVSPLRARWVVVVIAVLRVALS